MKYISNILVIFFCAFVNAQFTEAARPLDFDGDGKSDFAVTRNRTVGSDTVLDWYIAQSSNNVLRHAQWGIGNAIDFALPADYDGDGKTDIAVWRPSATSGQSFFFILNSSNGTVRIEQFGAEFDNIREVLGDYDGDGKADLTVYRSFGTGTQSYYIYRGSLNNPNGNLTYVPWGTGGARPYLGDFDGDGKVDFCVRPVSSSLFVLRRSSDSVVEYISWGLSTDAARPGDYDGDGRTDFCVLRTDPSQYHWYILERDGGGTGATPIRWGRTFPNGHLTLNGDRDYDGDGLSDIGVWRAEDNEAGVFFIRRSSDGSMLAYQLGTAGDSPF